jgi:AraC family transcriptional regulator, exoenzyme S synthesis regulatory protein ExsA
MLKILPQLFYHDSKITKVLVDGLSCIVHKQLSEPVLGKEGYVSTHAITLVLKGVLRAETDGGVAKQVNENEMIFLPRGIYTISDIIPRNGSFEAVVFFFDEELIATFINSCNLKLKKDKPVAPIIFNYTPEIRAFTESLLAIYTKKEFGIRKLTKTKLLELLHIISVSRQNDCLLHALSTLHNKERKSLKEFMNSNFSKPLSISDYAYLTGRSLSSFRRDFISQFGISPKQWLIEMRLEKARSLLSNHHTTISQVALESGYEDTSHFIKVFHKKYGISPKQFLLQLRKEVLV